MKVELKDLSETRKQLLVSLETAEVDAELNKVTGEFVRAAKIPGFRPGKAPAAVIRKRFEKEIAQELAQAVVSRAYRDGIKESSLDVLRVIDVPAPVVNAGEPATIEITVDVHPKFELPDYKGLPVTALDTTVTDQDVDAALEALRKERAEFKTVEREAGEGDYVKFGFEGTVDGRKIAELVPERPIYGQMPQTWEEAGSEEGLLPGMGKAVVGMKAGDAKEVTVAFPDTFNVPQLAGKTGQYSVSVQEVRQRVLPELDDAFLQSQQVASVDELKERIRQSLVQRKESEDRADRRRQVAEALAGKVEFPIPETLIDSETEVLLRQLVEQNVRRGIPQEELEKNKEEIYATARKTAIGRTKVRMLLARVAEAEQMKIERDDINRALVREAMRSGQRPEKLVKELEKDRDRLQALQHNVLIDKALDFLVDRATVSTP
ncbi:trigger factor [Opitutales bacterium ASA1]|uniref:trigger factor n=1 Tax=Congregicoccus parvus TaxID=3081749 RepID=UPI002B2E7271|nr:trigger factor [Opitutales bacterium ASA1]